jgi:hypothetical protein
LFLHVGNKYHLYRNYFQDTDCIKNKNNTTNMALRFIISVHADKAMYENTMNQTTGDGDINQ